MGRRFVLPLATVFALIAAGPSHADRSGEAAYLQGFGGEWSATGKIRENAQSSVRNVTCALNGTHDSTSAALRGTCRTLGIFWTNVSVELEFDTSSGRYSGVYKGSPAGDVRLAGTRDGDVLTLTATWPKEINGDRVATFIIQNPREGQFVFLLVDRIAPDGPIETMTNLTVAAM